MIYFIVGMSFFIFMIGRLISITTAPYLLSGYNTMSKEDQAKVNLHGLVDFWRNFHSILAVIIIVVCLGIYYFFDVDWGVLSLVIVVLIGYVWAISKSMSYYPPLPKLQKNVIFSVQVLMFALCIYIMTSFIRDTRDSEIVWHHNGIEFSGYQGTKIYFSNITETKIITEPLDINMKVYGLGTKKAKKGLFDIKKYGRVRLLMTQFEPPYLLIKYGKKDVMIYNSPMTDVEKIHEKLMNKR